EVDDAGLERCVDAAERHVDGLRAIGGEQRVLGWSRLYADLVAVEVADRRHRPLAVQIAKTERGERQHVPVLDGRVEHLLDRGDEPRVGDRLDQLVLRAEEIVDGQYARL